MMRPYLRLGMAFIAVIVFAQFSFPDEFSPDSITSIIRKVTNYRLKGGIQKLGDGFTSHWDWDDGAYMTGVMAAYRHTKDQKYLDSVKAWAQAKSWQTPNDAGLSRNPDNQCIYQSFCEAYMIDPKPANEFMISKWKDNYHLNYDNDYSQWYWCDALYMAPPAISMLGAITDSIRFYDTLCVRWSKWQTALYSTQYHIYWRDAGYKTQTSPNGKPVFWGPGEAWVLGGLARVLKYMPATYAKRDTLIKHFREQCAALIPLQQGDGLWTTSLLDSVAFPDHETSCTAFFCFAMAWGINNGILDKATFEQTMRKSWSGLVRNVSATDGRLQRCQGVSTAPGGAPVSNSSAEGEGAFLLAAEEMYKYVTGMVGTVGKAAAKMDVERRTSGTAIIHFSNSHHAIVFPENISGFAVYTVAGKFLYSRPVFRSEKSFGIYSNEIKLSEAIYYIKFLKK
jgi:unsaturated rhamnogalacturonyl hydrolase